MLAALPSVADRPSTRPLMPRPGVGAELRDAGQWHRAFARRRQHGGGQRMLAPLLERGREPQRVLDRPSPNVSIVTTRGLPSVSVPVLSMTSVSTDSRRSSASAFLIEDAGGRAASGADHDRHRRGEAQRARAGDDQHRHGVHQRVRQPRLRTDRAPDDERHDRGRDDRRNEPAGDQVGQPLDRRAAALGLGDHPHDLGKQRVAADPLGLEQEGAAGVDRAAGHAAAGFLLAGIGSPVTIDSSTALRPSMHHAVDRHFLAGTHAADIADAKIGDRHVQLDPVPHHPRRSWRQAEQLLDGAARAAARAQFQHLAEEHQRRDHRRGIEVGRHHPMLPKPVGEQTRGDRGQRRCSRTRPRRRCRSA